MKIIPRSFPYPVLSKFTDDIVPNGFEVTLVVTTSKSDFLLAYQVSLEHEGIRNLIIEGNAKLVVHVECQSNFYRGTFTSYSLQDSIRISVTELMGKVEVSFFVVAGNKHPAYRVEGMHEDYGPLQFSISGPDILAMLETKYFVAEKDPNVLKKISSIIQVAQLDTGKTDWEIDLDDHAKIYVRMSAADMEAYGLMRESPHVSKTLMSLIVLPALVEALYFIKGVSGDANLEQERSRRWFSVLELKLTALGINLESSGRSMFEVAQAIMEHPSAEVFSEMDRLIAGGSEQ